MRRVIFAILFVLIFVAACSSHQSAIKGQDTAKIFTAMNDDVKYSETKFSGEKAGAIADLVKAECPNGVGESFVRATLEASAATLIIYTSPDGKNVTCSILKPKEMKNVTIKTLEEAPDEETILTVNGRPITRAQAQQLIEQLPEGTQLDDNTTTALLNTLVNQELIRQQAENISVTDKEIADMRQKVLAQANITEEELAKRLTDQNASAEFNKTLRAQTQSDKLLRQRLLLDELNVSAEDAREYYLANTNRFIQSEQAVARYIVISAQNRSAEQVRNRADLVTARLNKTDFCELVNQYSDDENGKKNCGVYVVPRGVLGADLEFASFNTPENQTAAVTTQAGTYFVQTLQVNPAQVVPYTQIAGNLQSGLRDAIAEERLNLYLAMLRNKAEIVSYLG